MGLDGLDYEAQTTYQKLTPEAQLVFVVFQKHALASQTDMESSEDL
jgi:hypothetical protein